MFAINISKIAFTILITMKITKNLEF